MHDKVMLAGAAVPGAVVTWADSCGIQRASSPAGRYLAAVRTRYEIEDTDGYLAARELLLRRCGSWAAANDRPLSPPLAGALLDSRHFSSDGRLGYWTRPRYAGHCSNGFRGRSRHPRRTC